MEDDEGKGVLVGRWELGYGLQRGGKAVFFDCGASHNPRDNVILEDVRKQPKVMLKLTGGST